MKKKILGSIAVFAIAAIAAFNVNVNTKVDGLSNVSLDNVEALAQESIFDYYLYIVTIYSPTNWKCSAGGGMYCPY